MNDDLHIMVATKTNLQHLSDVEVVMGLTCIMPLLEAIHALIKFVQAHDTCLCDFLKSIKMCCVKLYNFYLDLRKKYVQKNSKKI
jgi:hypothetical protein